MKSAELASVVEQLKQEPEEFDVDDSVQGTNVVFNQLSVCACVCVHMYV